MDSNPHQEPEDFMRLPFDDQPSPGSWPSVNLKRPDSSTLILLAELKKLMEALQEEKWRFPIVGPGLVRHTYTSVDRRPE